MKYDFKRLTTARLKEIKEEINAKMEDLHNELHYVKEELKFLSKQKRRLSEIIISRGKSPYDGQYYNGSDFRIKYKKPYIELSAEEKAEYQHNYWIKYKKKYHKKSGKKELRNENIS